MDPSPLDVIASIGFLGILGLLMYRHLTRDVPKPPPKPRRWYIAPRPTFEPPTPMGDDAPASEDEARQIWPPLGR